MTVPVARLTRDTLVPAWLFKRLYVLRANRAFLCVRIGKKWCVCARSHNRVPSLSAYSRSLARSRMHGRFGAWRTDYIARTHCRVQ